MRFLRIPWIYPWGVSNKDITMKRTLCKICRRDKYLTRKAVAVRKIPSPTGPKGSINCKRRERPVKVCEECYQGGNFRGLANAVLLQSIKDYRKGPGPYLIDEKRFKNPKRFADFESAKGFLFSGEVEFWATFTAFTVERVRYMANFPGELNLNTEGL